MRSAEAQLRSSEAQVTQAQASLNQNQVNLEHTVIEAPIDGLVISRNVDVGQTVAASMQAPTLFVLAADLTKMQVVANLDESDVGRIRPGQHVTLPRRCLPGRGLSRHGRAGAAAADRAAERRHLRDGHRRAEPRAEAEAGHDGERQRRDRPAHRRAARAERRASVPADERDLRGARPDAAARRGRGDGPVAAGAAAAMRAADRGGTRRRRRGSTAAPVAPSAGTARRLRNATGPVGSRPHGTPARRRGVAHGRRRGSSRQR